MKFAIVVISIAIIGPLDPQSTLEWCIAEGSSMIKYVKFVSVPTQDQNRALEFYTEKLGFEVATDQPFDDTQRWIELRIANSATRLVLFTPKGHEDRVGTFFNGSLACDNVEATYRQLRARGVEFLSEPQEQPWGTFATFKDPDGNVWEMHKSI